MFNPNVTGAELISNERQRQIYEEGFTPEHDNAAIENELAYGAICYAYPKHCYIRKHDDTPSPFPQVTLGDDGPEGPGEYLVVPPTFWPYNPELWRPVLGDRIRELTKSGAMIAAEIDRLTRMKVRHYAAVAKNISLETLEAYDPDRMKKDAVAVTRGGCPAWAPKQPGSNNGSLTLTVFWETRMERINYDRDGKPLGDHAIREDLHIQGIIPKDLEQ